MNATRTRRTTSRRTTGSRRRSSTRTSYRRRRPGLSTTVGSAIGTLAVTTLLDLSWPARIGLFMLAVVIGLGYMLWRHRGEIAAGAGVGADPGDPGSGDAAGPLTSGPAAPPVAGAPGLPQDAVAPSTLQDRPTPTAEENPS